MRRILCVIVAGSLLATVGCGEEKKAADPAAEGGEESAAASADGAAAEAPPADEAPPEPPPKTSIDGVPDLDLTIVGPKPAKVAAKANKKGLKHHRKKKWSQAIAGYIKALESDPGHILTRFNLGCAYAQDGQRDNALAILKQFKEAEGCHLCLGRLDKAPRDGDYKSLWQDPEFKALTAGVVYEQPDYRKITVGFLKKMGDASWGLLRKGTEAGHGLVLKSNQGDRLITNRADLIKWKVARGGKGAAYHPGGTYEYSLVCKGTCCSVGVADEDGHYGTHMVTGNINEVCYWPISSTEAYVRSIKVWENEMYND